MERPINNAPSIKGDNLVFNNKITKKTIRLIAANSKLACECDNFI